MLNALLSFDVLYGGSVIVVASIATVRAIMYQGTWYAEGTLLRE